MLDSNISSELSVAASEYVKEGEYWIKKLSGDLVKTSFPYDQFHTGDIDEVSMQSVELKLTGEVYSKLMWICKGGDHTLHMILVTGLIMLLYKYTGHKDIIVGAPIYKQDIEGELVNTVLALRSCIDDNMTFKELLLQVRQTVLEANDNQNYPLETLLFRLNIPFTKTDFPLFDVVVLLENIHDRKYIEHIHPNVMVSFRRTDEVVEGVIEFNSFLFESSTVQRIAAHFIALLQDVLFHVDRPMAGINILSAEEQGLQLVDFNKTRAPYPAGQTIHRLIEERAARTPGNTALLGQISISYRELEERANQLANYLCKGKNIQPGDRVGILMDNSIALVTAILGILKAGAAYVPIDPVLPEERLKFIIDDAKPGLIISLKKHIRILNRLQWECVSFNTFLCMDSRDIYGEEEKEKSELMDEKLWDYVAETAVDEITGGGWNSSYTGEPFSKQEMDEYGDNVLEKLTPVLRPDMRVLEIGCASGISMYRIAPRVGYYHGTDLSSKMIERNKERVKREGHKNITLSCVPAHLIDTIKDRNFDLIILNSVVQSFHGHNYLRKVIRKTIDLLGQGGHLFVGDIMDHDLKEVLMADLKEFKRTNRDKNIQTKTDFSTELFVARGFLEDLQVDMPEISAMEWARKIYTIENELTKYRYDVLFTVDKTGEAGKAKKQKYKYQEDLQALEMYGTGKADAPVTPGHPAYVIYTSGTTGSPRGVMIEHRSLVNYAWWAVKTYIKEEIAPITVPLYSSISFDLTVTSIYLPLLTGGTIAIYPVEDHGSPVQRIVSEDRVDILKATPSHLKLLRHEMAGNNKKLGTLIVGGEELERALAQDIYLGFSRRVDIYNEYGPTEATVGCMIYKFNYEKDRHRSVSIGLPADNVSIYILDPCLNPVPINGIGEIYIGGDGLARGYLNQPELTAEKFLSLFYRSYRSYKSYISKRLYKTGDLARRLPDGNIEFLGRVDEQVKIRGYRIELKEIQSRLLIHSDVKEAVVIAKETPGEEAPGEAGDKALCAYIVPEKEIEISKLIAYLSVSLPGYMVPPYIMVVEQIPLTPNGKVDKRALPEPGITKTSGTYTAPGNKTQVTLVEIWSRVLAVEKSMIGIDANFFELGGHSLKATILISEIHKALQVKVPLAEIFKHPYIRELADYIDRKAVEEFYRIEPVEKRDYYVLSSAQKRLYILQQMDPNDVGYNESIMMILEGRPDRKRLEDTFQKLIRRHESLRTGFHMVKGEPVQRVHDEVQFQIEYYNKKEVEVKVEVEEREKPHHSSFIIHHSFIRPFDLTRAPLLRVGLIREEEEKHVFMVDMHHIVTDGTSMGIITSEFMALYRGEEFTSLNIQYKDFSQWQNSETIRESLDKQEAFWLDEFKGEIPVLQLPADYARPRLKSFAGGKKVFDLSLEVTDKLRELARREEATMYMVLLGIFNILLSKLGNSEDIVVGTAAAGRRHADLQPIIGMFVNTLAVRNYTNADKTFMQLLKEVKERTLEAFENQDYPFEDLVERLAVPRDTGRNPLFEALFTLQNMEIPRLEISQLKLLPFQRQEHVTKFDLTLHGNEVGRRVMFSLEYCIKLFKPETIERIVNYFKRIASWATDMPQQKLSTVDLVSQQEKEQVLHDFNRTSREYPGKTIHQLFNQQAKETADAAAVVFKDKQVTYGELNKRATLAARQLKSMGVKHESVVGILTHRSIRMTVGILGVLKAGGAYLPIDPAYPGKRIAYMLEDAHAAVLLTQTGLIERENTFKGERIEIDDLPAGGWVGKEVENINRPGDAAYIMYTSGSTGSPKGVMVEHRNVIRLVKNTNFTRLTVETRILQTGAPVFDATTFEIWGALLNGGLLALVENEVILDAHRLSRAITCYHINTLWLTAPLFNQLSRQHIDMFAGLGYLLVGGDVLSPRTIARVRNRHKNLNIVNGYGPTENTTFSTTFLIDRDFENSIPIGRPINNSRAVILGKNGQLEPIGIYGQLCVGGDGVSRGYLNSPELTAERFDHDLWDYRDEKKKMPGKRIHRSYKSNRSYIPKRIYKTGDLARWLSDGNIEFLGRLDYQVKIRGFRIELGEIESQLAGHEAVKEAVVAAKEDSSGDRFLCAYIVLNHLEFDKASSMAAELREHLSHKLPDYMVPTYFVPLDKIPLTSNGKVDVRALPAPGPGTMTEAYVPPRDEIDEKIVNIWAEALGIEKKRIGIDDNFFEMGGQSLKAVRVVSQIHKELNVKLDLTEFFTNPTVRGLSYSIRGSVKDWHTMIKPVEEKKYHLLSAAQTRLYFLQRLDEESTAYNMPSILTLEGTIDKDKLEKTFKALIHRHESLRTSFEMKQDQPLQKVHKADDIHFKIELPGNREVEAVIRGFIRPFDLSTAPLLRVGLINVENKTHVLMVDMHHIISDAASLKILTREFVHLYTGNELPAPALQYKDFSEWQNSHKERETIQKQGAYWLKDFEGEIPVLDLPTDYVRPSVQSFEGDTLKFEIEAGQTGVLKKIAAEEGATLFMVILAIYTIMLSKISSQEDIIVGTDVEGRRHVNLEYIIGMIVNTLALRNYPHAEMTFMGFLKAVKEKTLKSFDNQDYPFEELVEHAGITRDVSRNPIFDVMFSFLDNKDTPEKEITGESEFRAADRPTKLRTTLFDLSLNGEKIGEKLFFTIEYCTKLFKKETIQRFSRYFKRIAAAVIRNRNLEIAKIEIISPEEKNQVLFDFNDTRKDVVRNKSYPQLFEEQVERNRDKIAAVYNNRQITYSELNNEAGRIAHYLSKHGVTAGSIVAVYLKRSIDMLAAIIGIFKAGGVYLPFEVDYPQTRITYMLEDSGAHMVITGDEHRLSPGKRETLCLHQIKGFRGSIEDFTGPVDVNPVNTLPHDLVYIIYTSGTTGKPKGVMIHQLGMLNHIYAKINDLCITGTDIIAQTASACFDISVWQFLAALVVGGETLIVDKEIVLEPRLFLRVLRQARVTILESVPSLMTAFLEAASHEPQNLRSLKYLRWMIPTGEPLTVSLVRDWFRYYPGIKLVNAYGPTEASDDVTHYIVRQVPSKDQTAIPIGKPLQNLHIYILDKHLSLCPVGVKGEICVAGIGVGKGYWKDKQKTARAFIPNPFFDEIGDPDYALLYRTGDIGYFREDGNIECLGRLDDQVKIRGNRVQLSEIQRQLSNHDEVKEALVMAKQDETGDKYLCSYLVLHSSQSIAAPGIKAYLLKQLPDFMVPSYFIFLDQFPLAPSGKIDRKALPEPQITAGDPGTHVTPRNELEEKLVKIWQRVLSGGDVLKTSISIDDNFFELGGHSLKAILMAAKIHKELNIKLPLAEVFRTPTIRELSKTIQGMKTDKYAAVKPVEKKEYYTLSSAQKRLYILQQLDEASTTYNTPVIVQLEGTLHAQQLEETFNKLISKHESMRTAFVMIHDQPVQRVYANVDFQIRYYHLDQNSETQGDTQAIINDFIQPYDLSQAPLLRVGLIKAAEDDHVLMTDMHHIISDGVSLEILVKEFTAVSAGVEPPLLRIQYKDYSEWLNSSIVQETIKQQEEFWLKEFEKKKVELNMPTDYARPITPSFEGASVGFEIIEQQVQGLERLAAKEDVTLFMVLLAIYYVLLSKISGREDIVVGIGVAGRRHEDLQNIIGMFVNTLALRNYPTKEISFPAFLAQVKEKTLQAFENQDYQFEELAAKVAPNRDRNRNPLFDMAFVFEKQETKSQDIPTSGPTGLLVKPRASEHTVSRFDMTFFVTQINEKLRFVVEYSTKLFKEETILRFTNYFKEITSAVVENNNIKLRDIAISHHLSRIESNNPNMELAF